MIKSVREKVGLGENLFYDNDRESMNDRIKKRKSKGSRNLSWTECVDLLQSLSEEQECNAERPLIDKGPYELSTDYAHMRIPSASWLSLSQQQRQKKVLQFHSAPTNYTIQSKSSCTATSSTTSQDISLSAVRDDSSDDDIFEIQLKNPSPAQPSNLTKIASQGMPQTTGRNPAPVEGLRSDLDMILSVKGYYYFRCMSFKYRLAVIIIIIIYYLYSAMSPVYCMAGRRVLSRSVLLVLVLTLISALDPPKLSVKPPNSYWSLCKVLDLDRECYSRFSMRKSTQRYSRFITRNTTKWYCSVEVVSPVLKVGPRSGLRLFDATLVASYLLLLAGDICENPGPVGQRLLHKDNIQNLYASCCWKRGTARC